MNNDWQQIIITKWSCLQCIFFTLWQGSIQLTPPTIATILIEEVLNLCVSFALGAGHVQSLLAQLLVPVSLPSDASLIRDPGVCLWVCLGAVSRRHRGHFHQHLEVFICQFFEHLNENIVLFLALSSRIDYWCLDLTLIIYSRNYQYTHKKNNKYCMSVLGSIGKFM